MEAFFLPTGEERGEQRLCVHHAPALNAGEVRGSCLYLHPFAEEMNKSRRMAALQARALAAAGFAVLQIDLKGCGDSSGDFAEASWDCWIADACRGAEWLAAHYEAPLWLWGLRAGCLLACDAAPRLSSRCNFLFWQPPTQGKVVLQQFLRLRMAAEMLEGRGGSVTERLRAELAAGQAVDVAGYRLGPHLSRGLEEARLRGPSTRTHGIWLETSSRQPPDLLPATQAAAQAWRDAGHDIVAQAVPGPAFWQTQEIEDAPCLVNATVAALQSLPGRLAA